MAYPKNLLQEGEETVLDRNPHWSFMLSPIAMMTGSVIVLIVLLVLQPSFAWVGLLAILLACLGSLGRYLRWRTTEFVVTTERVISRQGIIAKSGIEIPLDRIVNISYRQSVWERILGSGDLLMESAGETGREPFTDVARPAYVQNLIYRQMEDLQARDAKRQADFYRGSRGDSGDGGGSRHLTIPEQIEKLAELRDRGIITDYEFEEKKQKLLDQL